MKQLTGYCSAGLVLAVIVACAASGCRPSDRARWDAFWGRSGSPKGMDDPEGTTPAKVQPVPPPLHVLLPKRIRIHPFTGTSTFKEGGGAKGIDVQIEAKDAYGDATKAFGNFRFELYSFMPNSTDPKAGKLVTWEVPLTDPKTNLVHWDSISRAYKFKLEWDGVKAGQKYVLVAVFASPYTRRLFAERVFVAGQ